MNLTKLTPWLTIAANFGLLLGMVLVAYEINQNSQLARTALVNEEFAASNQFWADLMGETPADVIAMAVECPEGMAYSDFIVMDAFLFTGINLLYRDFELAQEGIFTEEDWRERVEGYAAWYLGNPFGQAWWDEEGRYFFADDFVAHVDKQLDGSTRDSYGYYLGVRTRLLSSGNKGYVSDRSRCPPQESSPDMTDAAN